MQFTVHRNRMRVQTPRGLKKNIKHHFFSVLLSHVFKSFVDFGVVRKKNQWKNYDWQNYVLAKCLNTPSTWSNGYIWFSLFCTSSIKWVRYIPKSNSVIWYKCDTVTLTFNKAHQADSIPDATHPFFIQGLAGIQTCTDCMNGNNI